MSSTPNSSERTDYWQQQISLWRSSGQSQKGFCTSNDLNYPRFVYWLRKSRRSVSKPKSKASRGFVPAKLASLTDPHPVTASLSLMFPNGIELRGIAAENLSLVDQLLRQWP
ncbi:MAG: hypothetical protein OEX12_15535 [Gammaproteobacteria bacterium]|nr:hypothetical protein [Gammaproteobacteria bacterium]